MVDINRYSGQIAINDISIDGQKRLSGSTVAVVGIGGNGAIAAELFARMGIGRIRVIDNDSVRENNLHRQFLYGEDDLGKPKVISAAGRLKAINRSVEVDTVNDYLTEKNSASLIRGSSLVYDGTDNFASRYAINSACFDLGIPFVMTSSIQYWGEIIPVLPGKTACLKCLNIPVVEEGSCSRIGIFPPAVVLTAAIAVSAAVSILTGKLEAGYIKIADARNGTVETVITERNPACPVCGKLTYKSG